LLIKKHFIKKGLKKAPNGETLPKKHHDKFTLKDTNSKKLTKFKN
tara:strand:- start:418 stop:552 length:135 start_codon:yes stop_codon:yes gene_type:complete